MMVAGSPLAPGDGAPTLDAITNATMMVVGGLSLLLMVALNIVGVWWVVRQSSWRTPKVQHTEDEPGWSQHAERVVRTELEVARLRADHPDVPTA